MEGQDGNLKGGRNIRYSNRMDRDKIKTRGWEVMVPWRDGSTDWIQPKYIKGPKNGQGCGVFGCELYIRRAGVCLVGFQGTEAS